MREQPRRIFFPQSMVSRLAERAGLSQAYLQLWRTTPFFWAANAPAWLVAQVAGRRSLPPAFARMLDDLRRDGCAFARFEDLWDASLLDALDARSLELAHEIGPKQRALGRAFMRLEEPPTLEAGGALAQLAMDPLVLLLASRYLGVAPRFRGLGLWQTYPYNATRVGPQMWHRDSHDHRFFKVTILLNEYGEENGAMQYLRGTHFQGLRRDALRPSLEPDGSASRYADDDVARELGDTPVTHFVGGRGTVIFFDTSGVHRSGYDPVGERRIYSFYYNTLANTDRAEFRRRSLRPTRDALVDYAFGLV